MFRRPNLRPTYPFATSIRRPDYADRTSTHYFTTSPFSLMLRFAPATAADVPALNRLVNRAYRGEASEQGWTTESGLLAGQRTDEAYLREQLAQPGATFLLARRATDAELVGSVFLQVQGPELYLGMLSVEPTLQAGGIGRQLVLAAGIFGVPAIAAVFVTRKFIVPAIPKEVFSIGDFVVTKSILMMVLFAILMVFASVSMIGKKQKKVKKN